MSAKEFGIIGLGRMGGNLALQAIEKGVRVVGFTHGGVSPELIQARVTQARDLKGLATALHTPRVVFLYIPAGPAVDTLLDEMTRVLQSGDIVVDGGNSYWGDSIRRHQRLQHQGLEFVDLGTSGGIEGARHGACFMAGGSEAAIRRIEPILKMLALPGGYVHAGGPGAGHFTKLVHNGIEFGMLQAIGEGLDLLEHFPERLKIANVLECWRHGSVIRSWLIDLLARAYHAEDIKQVPSYVEDTGEVNWLVDDAIRMEVPVPVIAQSVMQLFASRDEQKLWARAIAMMRHGFGGHPYGPSAPIRQERRTGRISAAPTLSSDGDLKRSTAVRRQRTSRAATPTAPRSRRA